MKMAALPSFFIISFWIVVICIVGIVVFLWLFISGGEKYSVEDAEAHAEDFAGVIKEGHGGMTVFLWVSFALIFSWTIFYFIINGYQFLVIFALGFN